MLLFARSGATLFNKWKGGIFNKATIENIGADKYSQLLVIVPPINEQVLILEKFEMDSQKNRHRHLLQASRNRKTQRVQIHPHQQCGDGKDKNSVDL